MKAAKAVIMNEAKAELTTVVARNGKISSTMDLVIFETELLESVSSTIPSECSCFNFDKLFLLRVFAVEASIVLGFEVVFETEILKFVFGEVIRAVVVATVFV